MVKGILRYREELRESVAKMDENDKEYMNAVNTAFTL